jgi:hypothetical protein
MDRLQTTRLSEPLSRKRICLDAGGAPGTDDRQWAGRYRSKDYANVQLTTGTLPPRAMRILRIARKPGIKDHPAEKISAKARGRTAGMQDFPGCRSA